LLIKLLRNHSIPNNPIAPLEGEAPAKIIAAIAILDLHATQQPQQPPSTPPKCNEAPDGLGSIEALRGLLSVKLATPNIVLTNES
jgi:hypothetical protein